MTVRASKAIGQLDELDAAFFADIELGFQDGT